LILWFGAAVSTARSGLRNYTRALAEANQPGRNLLACDLTFQAKKNTEQFDRDYRLATLQDVTQPVEKSLFGILKDGDTALLVDGWVSYSEIRTTPIQTTGSDDKPFLIRTKLGIHDCGIGSDLDDADNIDIVSKGADPSGMLHKRGTDLEPRAKDKFTTPNSKQLDIIKQAIKIAFPNDFHTIDSLKQTTYTVFQGFRVDQQKNGGFVRNGQRYVEIAVQQGSLVFAAAVVPFNEFVSGAGIRKALFLSVEQQLTTEFAIPPANYRGLYKWVITTAAAVGSAVFLVLG